MSHRRRLRPETSDIDYNSIDCSVLGANDLSVVKEAIVEVSANYYHLGVQLDVPPYELDKLPSYDVNKAFSDMVHLWLKGTSTKRGNERTPPSWRSLVRAVESRAGGNNYALAKRIASEHRADQGGDVDTGTAAALVSRDQESKQNAPSEIYKPLSQPKRAATKTAATKTAATKTADSQCTGTRCCLIAAALVVVILAVCGSSIFLNDGDKTVDPVSNTYGNDFDDRSLPHNSVKPTVSQMNSLDGDRDKDPAPNTHSNSYGIRDDETVASDNFDDKSLPRNNVKPAVPQTNSLDGDGDKDPAPNTHSSSYGSGSDKRNNFPHMNDGPTMPQLSNLKRKGGRSPVKIIERIVGEKSSALGDILLNDEHGARMKNIKHKEQDVEAVNREMFRQWLQGGGARVSWKVLVDALDTVGLKTLANDIIDALSNAKG